MFACASIVEPAMCGVRITFSNRRSGERNSWSLPSGSAGNTSKAAPPRCLRSRASAAASMSITVPREALMSIAPGFRHANCSQPIMPRVSGVSGTWKVTTSAAASTSSSVGIMRALPRGSLVTMS